MKTKVFLIIAFVCAIFAENAFSQERNKPFAIGINYERINDPADKFWYENGVFCDYNTHRDYLSIEALYGLSSRLPRLKMTSALGVSFYNSQVDMTTASSRFSISPSISATNLILSQKVLYDVVHWHKLKFIGVNLSPYMSLSYEKPFWKKNETGRFDDLDSDAALNFINEFQLPAVSAKTKMPDNLLSVSVGLSLELVLLKRVGVFYNAGYSYGLLGHSEIDMKFKYTDEGNIYTNILKSGEKGIHQTIGLRCYF